jgi:hypothetical protein
MAAKDPKPVSYDPATHYGVKVTRPVKLMGLKITPMQEVTLLGSALTDLITLEGSDVVAIAVAYS